MGKSTIAIGLSSAALVLGIVAVTLQITENKPKHQFHKQQMHKMHKAEKCKKAMMENRLHNAQARFEKIDTNKDGNISLEEWNASTQARLAKLNQHKA